MYRVNLFSTREGLGNLFNATEIVILNDNFRVFFARDQALIIFDRRINKNNLPSHK